MLHLRHLARPAAYQAAASVRHRPHDRCGHRRQPDARVAPRPGAVPRRDCAARRRLGRRLRHDEWARVPGERQDFQLAHLSGQQRPRHRTPGVGPRARRAARHAAREGGSRLGRRGRGASQARLRDTAAVGAHRARAASLDVGRAGKQRGSQHQR
eukprot:6767251-Prymnesium_polylepis.1